jgi:hypothetical protein
VAGIAEGSVLAPDEPAAERVERGIKLLLAFFISPPVLARRQPIIDACAVLPGALSLRDPLSPTSAR